ncbi:hypothetical protein UF75_4760 [Desulfosporosinus sp. I2]|uniref:hypothetical protein n=1 Tax=Desulfosporosinus sp. I2 TaxID=1617025 RepID=UPI00061E88E8|nr:hypothetical protein [Desulfosporosinus sp. I2]KJR44866.1 hypothetical protein UF75_4760 [Desulfosporosinus sp. I2]
METVASDNQGEELASQCGQPFPIFLRFESAINRHARCKIRLKSLQKKKGPADFSLDPFSSSIC